MHRLGYFFRELPHKNKKQSGKVQVSFFDCFLLYLICARGVGDLPFPYLSIQCKEKSVIFAEMTILRNPIIYFTTLSVICQYVFRPLALNWYNV